MGPLTVGRATAGTAVSRYRFGWICLVCSSESSIQLTGTHGICAKKAFDAQPHLIATLVPLPVDQHCDRVGVKSSNAGRAMPLSHPPLNAVARVLQSARYNPVEMKNVACKELWDSFSVHWSRPETHLAVALVICQLQEARRADPNTGLLLCRLSPPLFTHRFLNT